MAKGERVRQKFEAGGKVHIARLPRPYGLKAFCGVVVHPPSNVKLQEWLSQADPTCQVCIDAQAPESED